MLYWSLKKVCDEVSKIKNLSCTFFPFFRARHHGIWLFSNIHMCLAANWGRKWSVFGFWKKSKISQNVLQQSMNEKNDFLIFGRVKSFVGSSPTFCTPNFLSGAPEKCFNFMIALDHNLIFCDHQKNLKINLGSEAIIKFKPFAEAPDKKLGMENDGVEST